MKGDESLKDGRRWYGGVRFDLSKPFSIPLKLILREEERSDEWATSGGC